MSRETLFQPEGSAAPVQILGILEASGMAFDALWVIGLAADRWPPAPGAQPVLPIARQRERFQISAREFGARASICPRIDQRASPAAASEVVLARRRLSMIVRLRHRR